MRIGLLTPSLLVAPLLLAFQPGADQVTFHPSNDSQLSKKFTLALELELGDVSFEVNGQDMAGEVPSDVAAGVELSAEITDHYVKVEDGKPIELLRKFGPSKVDYHAMEEKGTKDDFIELEGKQVRFKWNGDTKEYDVSFAEGEGDPQTLEMLGVDMDLRTFLPGRAVAQGDKWSVDGKGLRTALLLGLNLEHMKGLSDDLEGDEAKLVELLQDDLLPQLEKLGEDFKATCEYTGQRDIDGHKVGAIKIKLDVKGGIDLASIVRKAIDEEAGDEQIDLQIDDASLKLKIDGEGELLWDMTAGHAHAFDMNAAVELAAKLAMAVKAPEQVDITAGAELLGKSHWTMELK